MVDLNYIQISILVFPFFIVLFLYFIGVFTDGQRKGWGKLLLDLFTGVFLSLLLYILLPIYFLGYLIYAIFSKKREMTMVLASIVCLLLYIAQVLSIFYFDDRDELPIPTEPIKIEQE